MIDKHKITLGSTVLLFGLATATVNAAEGLFQTSVSMGPFEAVVQITPPGQDAPSAPREGQLLVADTEVRTLEEAKAEILYNCEIDLPGGQGYVLGGAAECVDETADIKEAGLVNSPAQGQEPGQCEDPIAYIREYDASQLLVNGVPPPAGGGQIELCVDDSVVAGAGSQAQVVYPCKVIMEENSQLIVQDGKECALAALVLTETGALGAAGVAPVLGVGAGVPIGPVIVGGALGTSVIIGIANNDDDDSDPTPPQVSPN